MQYALKRKIQSVVSLGVKSHQKIKIKIIVNMKS